MLNDFGRNSFYQEALQAALARILAIEANPGFKTRLACASRVGAGNLHLAELAAKTIEGNRMLYPNTNISLIAQLSTQVDLGTLGGKADILVTETFGTMLLGEGALTFLSDAREKRDSKGDRLLKEGGQIIPAGGCQYVTLVQMSEAVWSPPPWRGFNLSQLEDLQDTVYWKADSDDSTRGKVVDSF
ncbi:PRMT7 [Symbiodinium natans]|uniref:PRMT7 protein n=1 Tax=Symbiodinium natans TaxID=878477 RepID=A0A812NXM0_9DINO|nr:PRMT7 [Symbiodinium natans]